MRISTCSFNEAAGIPRGRLGGRRQSAPWHPGASMRPRVFPAEDALRRAAPMRDGMPASMRPRVFPAEDFHLDYLSC